MKILLGLQDQEVSPIGWENFGLTRNYEVKGNRISVTSESLELANEDAEIVREWVYNQYGRFVNVPSKLISDTGFTDDLYLDLKTLVIKDSGVRANLQVRKGNDHFFERANGLTFSLLHAKGVLPESIYVDCPYQIVKDYTDLEKLILAFTFLSLTQTAYQIIKDSANLVAEIANPFNIVVLIIKLVIYAIWLVATIILLVKTLIEIKEIIFPKTRFLKMASDYDLIRIGCDFLGFTFVSNYLYERKDTHFILTCPESRKGESIFDKIQNAIAPVSFNNGYPTALDSVQTLYDVIQEWIEFHNLEMFVYGGVVRLEPKPYFDSTASLVLPRAFSNQSLNENEYGFNNDPNEVWRRKYLTYQVDSNERHSPDLFGETNAERMTDAINLPPDGKDLLNIVGMPEIRSKYALLKRKASLSNGEKLFKGIAKVIDNIAGTGFANNIQERIGIGIIENQYFPITKRVYANRANGKQPVDYIDQLSAEKIYIEQHQQDEVKNRNARRYKMTVPMHPNNFALLQYNNRFLLSTGELAKAMEVKYTESPSRREADVVYQIADESAFNMQTIKIT